MSRICSPLYRAYPDRLALFVAEGLAGLIVRRLGEPDPPPVEEDVRLVVDALTGGINARRIP